MTDFGGTFDPLADTVGASGDGVDMRALLLDAGVPQAEVDRASQDGTLELLAFEHMVAGDRPLYSLNEVSVLSGVPADRIRSYWRALGFPDPRPDEKLFGNNDLAMLSEVVWFISHGALERSVALQMARVIGSSVERIARAQVEAIETRRADGRTEAGPEGHPWDGDDDDEREQLAIRRATDLLPLMPRLMDFVWRRHVSDAARKRRLRGTGEGANLCVGFADLVGFTAQTLQMDEDELAEVIGRFETIAYDVVNAHDGRVVKMIGDEVMFVTEHVEDGARLALALAAAYRSEKNLSDVRVGLATGPVLEREGDVYGPVVNLASRIVKVAFPGSVVVSRDVRAALSGDEDFVLRSIRQHYLKDIGRAPLWIMRTPAEDADDRRRENHQRQEAGRDFLLSQRAERLASSHVLPGAVEAEVVEILEDAGLIRHPDHDEALITGEEPTREFLAITDVVLDAEIDDDRKVELLADIEAARRLAKLEHEAQRKADAADQEAEARIAAIEEEVRTRIETIELDARRRIQHALDDAERRSAAVNEEATRKVRRVASEVERKAETAERDARRVARRKAAQRKAESARTKRTRAARRKP